LCEIHIKLFMNIIFILMVLISLLASFDASAEVVNDFSRLNSINIDRVIRVESINDILKVVEYARKNNSKVSIAGKRNSQGGHTATKGTVVLNMEKIKYRAQ